MLKILQAHLLWAFVANLKIDAIYPESFCDKNLAVWKVFAFSDSDRGDQTVKITDHWSGRFVLALSKGMLVMSKLSIDYDVYALELITFVTIIAN